MRARCWILWLVMTIGCGAGTAAPATAARDEPSPAPTPALVIGGPVSWTLGQALRVDERGVVFGGEGDSSRMGTLTSAGELVVDGEVGARIADDGTVTVDGAPSPYRVDGARVVETSSGDGAQTVMHLEGSELLLDTDSRGERIAIEGCRPELTREVLFLSTVMLVGMTR